MLSNLSNIVFDWICNDVSGTVCSVPSVNYVPHVDDKLRYILIQYVGYIYLRKLGYTNHSQLIKIDTDYTSVTSQDATNDDLKLYTKTIEKVRNYCQDEVDPYIAVDPDVIDEVVHILGAKESAPIALEGYRPLIDLPFVLVALGATEKTIKKHYGTDTISTSNIFGMSIKNTFGKSIQYNPLQDKYMGVDGIRVTCRLDRIDAPVSYIGPNSKYDTKFKLLDCYDWTDCKMPLKDFVAFVANFDTGLPLEHYHMSDFGSQRVYSDSELFRIFASICRNVVSGDIGRNNSINVVAAKAAIDAWSDFCSTMMRDDINGLVATTSSNDLLAELLNIVKVDDKLFSYCTRPAKKILASEALAYSTSIYKHLIADRLIAAMEAVDDDTDTDEVTDEDEDEDTSDTDLDGDNDMSDDSSGGTDNDTGTGSDGVTDVPNEEDTEEENNKPAIDPNMALFELAKPNSSMKDWMYRTIVARKISAILKNPPENARPSDLILLKRWRSRWLYIVSIPCLRDVLSRISLRLS